MSIVVNGNHYKYTYGEAYIQAREDGLNKPLVDGKLDLSIYLPRHAPKLDRYEAIKYYNKKLLPYWYKQVKAGMPSNMPAHRVKRVLDYMLGRIDNESI